MRIEISNRDTTLDPGQRDQIINIVVGETLALDQPGAAADDD